jgi:hypothetical protein
MVASKIHRVFRIITRSPLALDRLGQMGYNIFFDETVMSLCDRHSPSG